MSDPVPEREADEAWLIVRRNGKVIHHGPPPVSVKKGDQVSVSLPVSPSPDEGER